MIKENNKTPNKVTFKLQELVKVQGKNSFFTMPNGAAVLQSPKERRGCAAALGTEFVWKEIKF